MSRFPNIIGQDRAKRKLSWLLDQYDKSSRIDHLLFNGPQGLGKTTLARSVAKHLTKDGRPKKYLEINSASIKNLESFVYEIAIPQVSGSDVTILFDECSELPKDVQMAMLSILNPENFKYDFLYEESVITFDFSRQSFLFATTDAQRVNGPLKERLERIDLENYSGDQMVSILASHLSRGGVVCDEGVLPDVASVLRGSAREASKMAAKISKRMAGETSPFDHRVWGEMRDGLSILPMGLTPIELNVLKSLRGRKGATLTQLAALTGMTRRALQGDTESYLMKEGLIEVRPIVGRVLTQKGDALLRKI